MKQLWKTLLWLYPKAHREEFAAEMETVFDQASEAHRLRGWLPYTRFAIREMCGVLAGAAAAWVADGRGVIAINMPDKPETTQTAIEANLRLMEHAIATHQFEKARFYSHYDLQLRERLKQHQTG